MIQIQTQNASLDLPEDTSITIKKQNPLFTILKKEDKQSYSYPFTLPLSARNNSALSNSLLEQKEISIPATVKKNGVRLLKADMILTERTNENYEVALQLNKKVDLFNRKLNGLWEQLGAFFITDATRYVDLHFRIFWINAIQNFTATVEANVTGIKYIITDTLDQIVFSLANAINADTANNNAIATPTNTGGDNYIRIEEANSSLPFFAFSQNWSTRFENGIALGTVGFIPLPKNDTANKNLAITHANTIDALADFREIPYCFPYFVAGNIYVNHHNQTEYDNYGLFSVILPSIRITALIEKVLSVEGWKLESVFLKEEEIEKLFITNAYGIARKTANDSINEAKQFLQFFWSDCLPDISFVEFVRELQNRFCLNVEYDHIRKILKIEPANSVITNKIAKEYRCTPVFSEKQKEKTEGYTFSYNREKTEADKSLNTSLLADKIVKNGTEEIVSNFPFLPTLALEDTSGFAAIQGLPRATDFLVPPSFAAFGYARGYELFISRKFVIKEGVIKSINFMSYIEDKRCTIDTVNYSLTWERLYEDFYKNYLSLLDNDEVERELICTFSELQSLDFLQRVRAEYNNYYIKELEYALTNSEQLLILGKVKLIKTI